MGRILADIVTVFWRDWIVLKRRMVKFILSRMVAPLLYLVAFGWGLGRSIQVESGSYLDFLVPGILALNSMNISFNSITPVHAERVYHKSLEEYIIAPIWPDAFVIGMKDNLEPGFAGTPTPVVELDAIWLKYPVAVNPACTLVVGLRLIIGCFLSNGTT
jgi:hypothetical protein